MTKNVNSWSYFYGNGKMFMLPPSKIHGLAVKKDSSEMKRHTKLSKTTNVLSKETSNSFYFISELKKEKKKETQSQIHKLIFLHRIFSLLYSLFFFCVPMPTYTNTS